MEEYRRAIGVIFQDFRIFAATIEENVILDVSDSAHEDVTPALAQAGFSEKTMVFISHRLSTTRIADTIFLIENGAVAEHGNHAELLSKNGRYAEMWHAQTSRYLKGRKRIITSFRLYTVKKGFLCENDGAGESGEKSIFL